MTKRKLTDIEQELLRIVWNHGGETTEEEIASEMRMLPPEWHCPNCGNRCFALPDYFDETLYRCPFCQRQFRREPDGELAPVAE